MDSLSSYKTQSWLAWFLKGALIVAFLILFTKMFEVQIIKGSYFRGLSEENRIRHIPIPAPRGRILASDGTVLVGNIAIKKRIKFKENGAIELTNEVAGASQDEIITEYKRNYPLADKFAHAGGYLGEVTDKEVNKINPDCPEKGPMASGSLVGVAGLEEEYECILLGTSGEELVEVDTHGQNLRSLGRKEPIPGLDVKTSINVDLQMEIAREMEDKKGAAIVTDTKGRILAFYSAPSFDPNLLVNHSDDQKISELFNSPDLPFFNRVISGTFHPGSVFKPLVAIAALEEGAIDKNFTYDDQGVIKVNIFEYTNWYFTEYGRKEGLVNLTRAIARSTDTFFYEIGRIVGPDAIAKWAGKFNLSKKTGIDIPGERVGFIPTPDWKKKVKKESWFLGNTFHMAIGQGDVDLTPIEINTFVAGVANGGRVCAPKFADIAAENCYTVDVKKENLDLVKEGMKDACSTGGTAYTFFDFSDKHNGTSVACKTGTAEVGTSDTPHAWFTVFAPIEDPQIVATILIEKGGQGSQVAGPIARKIVDYYFQSLETSH